MRWGPKAISVVTRTCFIEFVKRKSKREILSKLHSVSARFQDKKVLLILIEDFFPFQENVETNEFENEAVSCLRSFAKISFKKVSKNCQ